MKSGFLFVFILLFSQSAFGQTRGEIRGKITVNQKPVSQTVLLTKNGLEVHRVTSSGDGNYSFANLRPGKYVVSLADLGLNFCRPLEQHAAVAQRETVMIDFDLQIHFYADCG